MVYRIDLHVHTRYSGDTDSEPEEMVLEAISRNLDGIAFTEHYSFEASEHAENLRDKYSDSLCILRGVEFSAAEGHCLVFGVNTDKLSLKGAPVEELVRIVRVRGGVVIPAHPYRRGSGIGDIINGLDGISAVEGYNGLNLHSMNVKAISSAQSLSLPYTGGSDAHIPSEVGNCYTEFISVVTEKNFLDMLREGNYKGRDTRKVSRQARFI